MCFEDLFSIVYLAYLFLTGLHRQSRMDDDHKQGGFDHSHTDDTEFYEPVTAVVGSSCLPYV